MRYTMYDKENNNVLDPGQTSISNGMLGIRFKQGFGSSLLQVKNQRGVAPAIVNTRWCIVL